jgi:hypothetical protein
MTRSTSAVVGVGLAVWMFGPMLLGSNASGVELGQTPVTQPGELPACVSAHTFDSRFWGGWQTLRSDVWLTGCSNSAGQLRAASGPTCRATSFLCPGSATCTASPAGDGLKVVVQLDYPFGLDLIAGRPLKTAFTVSRSGGWTAVAP